MKPSEQCKAAGLKNLAELTQLTGVSKQTLINWHRNKNQLFEIVLLGATVQKRLQVIAHELSN